MHAEKNIYRDYVDDELMNYFQNKSPNELWKFSEVITKFGKADLKINNVKFNNKKYPSIKCLFTTKYLDVGTIQILILSFQ